MKTTKQTNPNAAREGQINRVTYKNTYWMADEKLASGENSVALPWGNETVRAARDSETGRKVSSGDAARLHRRMLAVMPLLSTAARKESVRVYFSTDADAEIQALFASAIQHGAVAPQVVAYERGTIAHGATARTEEELLRRVAAIVEFAGGDFDKKYYAPEFVELNGPEEALEYGR